MSRIIELAIIERNLIDVEIWCVKTELMDEDFPLSEETKQSLLIRLGCLDNNIKFLEKMIINGLLETDLPYTLNPNSFDMSTENAVHKQRLALLKRKTELEDQIRNCQDIKAINLIRAEYREVSDKLELYYDDEPRSNEPA